MDSGLKFELHVLFFTDARVVNLSRKFWSGENIGPPGPIFSRTDRKVWSQHGILVRPCACAQARSPAVKKTSLTMEMFLRALMCGCSPNCTHKVCSNLPWYCANIDIARHSFYKAVDK